MHIYKFTHIETGQWSWSDEQKEKLKPTHKKLKKMFSNKTWKLIDGKRVWLDKGASV